MDCIFCKIANKEINSTILFEDEKIIIFKDLNPEAPVHLLAIPKKHIESARSIDSSNSYVISHIFEKVSKLQVTLKLQEGFRVVTNCGETAGQTVKHLHFHILSGRKLSWPPG